MSGWKARSPAAAQVNHIVRKVYHAFLSGRRRLPPWRAPERPPKVGSFIPPRVIPLSSTVHHGGFAMHRAFVCSLFVSAILAHAADAQWVTLWPNGAPGSEGKTGEETVRTTPQNEKVIANVHRPSIGVILPSKETATGAAVVIAPGGGHSELW